MPLNHTKVFGVRKKWSIFNSLYTKPKVDENLRHTRNRIHRTLCYSETFHVTVYTQKKTMTHVRIHMNTKRILDFIIVYFIYKKTSFTLLSTN